MPTVKKNNLFKIWIRDIISISVAIFLISGCSGNKDIQVWVASPWQQVLRSSLPDGPDGVNLKSAANEYEPFRIIIRNSGEDQFENINVHVDNLKGEEGRVISSDNIKLYRAHYLHVTEPSHRTENPVGWYPDALIPYSGKTVDRQVESITYVASPFSIDTAQNAEVWCDLFVPSGTQSGVYRGNITVTAGNKKLARVPVHLEVWDFELPPEIAMRSHFGSLNAASGKMMGAEKGSEAFRELETLYNGKLLSHRAVPSMPDNIWPEWNETEGIMDRGESERLKKLVEEGKVNALDIPFRYYNEDSEKSKAYLMATADWLRKLGYLDMAYVYLKDEPNSAEQYQIVRDQGALIRSAEPGIQRMCTEQTITSNPEWGNLYGAVDIWCPLWGLFNWPTAEERLEAGEEIWSYTALCQGEIGTPWWQIDTEPLNFRSPFWLSRKFNITGYLYWSSTYWSAYETPQGVWEAPHFRDKFWGEGVLLYPGQPAGIKGFVPSIRLKLYREAMEDYEYMIMATKKDRGDEVDEIVNNVVTNFQEWSHTIGDYENARERLAQLIMENK